MYDYSGHVTRTPDSISGILERLLQLPFISAVNYAPAAAQSDEGYDGTVAIQTPTGPFQLNIQAKRSYLSIAAVSQLAGFLNQGLLGKGPDSLLLARHVPRLAALALVKAKINFADDAGNIHLALGGSYNWTVIGVPPLEPLSERRPVTPAELQLLFQFASWPESVNWPVRKLEPAVGISKSPETDDRRRLDYADRKKAPVRSRGFIDKPPGFRLRPTTSACAHARQIPCGGEDYRCFS